jgi:hypothetical protein
MGTRNIFGYFQTLDQAQKAADDLRNRGFETVSVDLISPMLGGKPYDPQITGILQNQNQSLAEITLGSNPLSDDQRILASANENASGMSGGTGFTHLEDVCVTVITEEERYEEANQLLEGYGARS